MNDFRIYITYQYALGGFDIFQKPSKMVALWYQWSNKDTDKSKLLSDAKKYLFAQFEAHELKKMGYHADTQKEWKILAESQVNYNNNASKPPSSVIVFYFIYLFFSL